MQSKSIMIVLILAIILVGGIFYYQYSKSEKEKTSIQISPTTSGSVAGISLDNSNNANNNSKPIESQQTSGSDEISNGSQLQMKLSEIRKPVNDSVYDVVDKMKYQKKFTKDDLFESVNIAEGVIAEGKKKMEELKVAKKYEPYKEKHLQAVVYLEEAITALQKFLDTGETKYHDEFNLKIDHSNREINDLIVPK